MSEQLLHDTCTLRGECGHVQHSRAALTTCVDTDPFVQQQLDGVGSPLQSGIQDRLAPVEVSAL